LDGKHDVSSETVRILEMLFNAGTAALRKFDRFRSGTAHFLRLGRFWRSFILAGSRRSQLQSQGRMMS
jgi:hypothetical protein